MRNFSCFESLNVAQKYKNTMPKGKEFGNETPNEEFRLCNEEFSVKACNLAQKYKSTMPKGSCNEGFGNEAVQLYFFYYRTKPNSMTGHFISKTA